MFAAHGVNMHADPGEIARCDPMIGTVAAPIDAEVEDAAGFARYREALRALPRIPSLLAGRDFILD